MPKPASIDLAAALERASAGGAPEVKFARVGPNAIIQSRAALAELAGPSVTQTIFERAGLARYLGWPPEEMIDEREAQALFAALRNALEPAAAAGVLRHAGALTGAYILANRIPTPAQIVLHALPPALSARLLLKAIRAHAWTFAGSGIVTCTYGTPMTISIMRNPLATPGCPWHLGVFDRLFASVTARNIDLRHTACCGCGDTVCRTEIRLAVTTADCRGVA